MYCIDLLHHYRTNLVRGRPSFSSFTLMIISIVTLLLPPPIPLHSNHNFSQRYHKHCLLYLSSFFNPLPPHMLEIIINLNDENDGPPLADSLKTAFSNLKTAYALYMMTYLFLSVYVLQKQSTC